MWLLLLTSMAWGASTATPTPTVTPTPFVVEVSTVLGSSGLKPAVDLTGCSSSIIYAADQKTCLIFIKSATTAALARLSVLRKKTRIEFVSKAGIDPDERKIGADDWPAWLPTRTP